MKQKARALKKAAGAAPYVVSAASGEGVQEVLRAIAREVQDLRGKTAETRADKSGFVRGWRP
jgi:GTP-binding protein